MSRTVSAAAVPLAVQQQATAAGGQATEQSLAQLLLVEDSPANQLVAASRLRHAGYQVDVVDNGEQALTALGKRGYQLVLMDVRMPVMDGLTATREIRLLSVPMRSVPIIALTAEVLPEELQRCLDVGMQDCVTKPIDFKLLQQKIEHWLAAGQGAHAAQQHAERAPPEPAAVLLDEETLRRLERELPTEAIPRMVAVFTTETRGRLAMLDNMIAASDWVGIGDQAHALKSSAASFGLKPLSDAAEALERACVDAERRATLRELFDAMQAGAVQMLHLLNRRYPPLAEGCRDKERNS